MYGQNASAGVNFRACDALLISFKLNTSDKCKHSRRHMIKILFCLEQ